MLTEHLHQLSKVIGARGSATLNERKAAYYTHDYLAKLGYNTEILAFKGLTTFSWLYFVFYLIPLVAWIYSLPILSFINAVVFFLELNTFPVLSRIFPKKQSQNVFARANGTNTRKVILVAHLDSSKAGLNFSPQLVKGFRTSFLIMAVSMILSPLTLAISDVWGSIFRWIALLPTLYLAFTALMLFHREVWNKYTDGANDNASGVAAALEIASRFAAEPHEGVDVGVLLTGCEESGTCGMIDFLDNFGSDHKDAFFINLDNIGGGTLYYMSGEGMMPVFKSNAELLDACATVKRCKPELDVKQGVYNLLTTDATPLLARKYKAISFLALDKEGLLPNWHWPSDVYENVEISTVETATGFVVELIKEMGRKSVYETRHLRTSK